MKCGIGNKSFDLINESFDSIPINVYLTNNRDSILYIIKNWCSSKRILKMKSFVK